jgi:hypothetical protein
LWDLRELVNKRIHALLRKHGFTVIRIEDFDHHSDYRERFDNYFEAKMPIVKAMLEKEGLAGSDLTAQVLSDFPGPRIGRSCPFGGLSALAEDDAFGVKCLHSEYRHNVKIMAGKGFNFSSNFRDERSGPDMTAESFADGGKEGRFAHYKNMLEELVDGITDSAERAEFVERVFNDAMRKSLNKAKN